jgi:hypothetical protein
MNWVVDVLIDVERQTPEEGQACWLGNAHTCQEEHFSIAPLAGSE